MFQREVHMADFRICNYRSRYQNKDCFQVPKILCVFFVFSCFTSLTSADQQNTENFWLLLML